MRLLVVRECLTSLSACSQDAEARHSELIARVPDSTRPLLRQIEALQEAAASRGEAWNAVERTLNARVQEAEVAAAGAQERERAATDRLTQAASRMAVMEAQVRRAQREALQAFFRSFFDREEREEPWLNELVFSKS